MTISSPSPLAPSISAPRPRPLARPDRAEDRSFSSSLDAARDEPAPPKPRETRSQAEPPRETDRKPSPSPARGEVARTAHRDDTPPRADLEGPADAQPTKQTAVDGASDPELDKPKTDDASAGSDAAAETSPAMIQAILSAPEPVAVPVTPAAAEMRADGPEDQTAGQGGAPRLGTELRLPLPLPSMDRGTPEPAQAALAHAAPGSAVGKVATAAEEPPTPAKTPETKGLGETVARLASALGAAQPSGGSATPGAAQVSPKAKASAAASDTASPDAEAATPGLPSGPSTTVPHPPAQSVSAEAARVSERSARDTGADQQPATVGDAPASGAPFALALAGADQSLPGAPALPGAAAGTHAATPVVENVPLRDVPVEIGLKSLAGVNEFEIRLAPDDLGRVDVKLHIDGEGRVKAHLIVDRPETLAFLQRDAAQLQQTLEQAGLKTQENGVSLTLRNGSQDQGFGQNGGSGANENSPRQSGRGSSRQADAPEAISGPTRRLLWGRPSGVDLHI